MAKRKKMGLSRGQLAAIAMKNKGVYDYLAFRNPSGLSAIAAGEAPWQKTARDVQGTKFGRGVGSWVPETVEEGQSRLGKVGHIAGRVLNPKGVFYGDTSTPRADKFFQSPFKMVSKPSGVVWHSLIYPSKSEQVAQNRWDQLKRAQQQQRSFDSMKRVSNLTERAEEYKDLWRSEAASLGRGYKLESHPSYMMPGWKRPRKVEVIGAPNLLDFEKKIVDKGGWIVGATPQGYRKTTFIGQNVVNLKSKLKDAVIRRPSWLQTEV